MAKITQKLLNKYKVTEWRNSEGSRAIYKTKFLGEEWMPMSTETYKVSSDDTFYASLSTKRMVELEHKTIRTIEA